MAIPNPRTARSAPVRLLGFTCRKTPKRQRNFRHRIASSDEFAHHSDASGNDAKNQRERRAMKVTVRDAEALHSLKPLETAAYLRSKGWKQEADFSTKGSLWLWQTPSGDEVGGTLL